MYLSRVLLFVGLTLALALPALALAVVLRRPRRIAPMAQAMGLFAFDIALLLLPRIGPFAPLRWNWQGKALSAAWPVALGLLGVAPSTAETGIVTRPKRGSLGPACVAAVVAWSTNLIALAERERVVPDPETLAFQLTMPGIAEEFVYRGVLLALFNRAFGRSWRLFGADVGWGWVITSVLFLVIHMVSVDAQLRIRWFLDPEALAGIALAGVAFGWMRERTNSIWPGVLAHNIANNLLTFGSLLFRR